MTQSVLRLDREHDGSLFESRRSNLLLFSGYRGSFPVAKRPGCDTDHSSPSSFDDNMSRRSKYTPCMCLHQDGWDWDWDWDCDWGESVSELII